MYKNKDTNANESMMKLRDGNDADIAGELAEIKVWKNAFLSYRLMDIG